jgi:hypothetical protein
MGLSFYTDEHNVPAGPPYLMVPLALFRTDLTTNCIVMYSYIRQKLDEYTSSQRLVDDAGCFWMPMPIKEVERDIRMSAATQSQVLKELTFRKIIRVRPVGLPAKRWIGVPVKS